MDSATESDHNGGGEVQTPSPVCTTNSGGKE